jgi:hypothetical protein
VCNGATGSTGTTGGDGRTSLVSVTGENPGTACAAGGTRVRTGIDSNGNGVLDDAEVSASAAVCNGSAGVGLGWTALSAGPVQALANQGYVADSGSEIVLTLPANPATGDLVRVTGAGGGGWRVAQGSGQWVDTTPVGAQALQEGALGASLAALDPKTMATVNGAPVVTTAGQCLDVAGSASGRRLALAFSALLYIGGDDGASWINVSPGQPSAVWPGTHSNLSHSTVAVSADGRYLISASGGNRRLQFSGVELRAAISDNGGLTWRDTAHAAAWSAAAMSANGSRIVLAEAGVGQGVTSVPGRLWISSDHGLTWAASGPALKWRRVKMSADGLRIVAVAADIDLGQFSVHTSSDGGQTWTSRLEGGQPFWMDAGISADGQRMVAMATDNSITNPGALRISDDGGQTWRDGPGGALRSVAVSADGRTVAALEYLGTGSTQLQLSSDGGRTWGSKSANVPLAASGIASDPTRVWLNADGSVLYFCGPPASGAERIYRSTVPGWAPASTTGSAGSLAGGRHSAVDLQYTGNGRWLVVGHLGTLWVR